MKHIVTRLGKMLGLAMIVGILVGLVGMNPVQAATAITTSAAPAAATASSPEEEECVTTGSSSNREVKMEACSYNEASHNVDVTLQDRATASGKIQLSYFNPNASAWSKASAMKCKLVYVSIKWSKAKIKRVVKAAKRKINGTWCIRLKRGSTWANSGKNGNMTVPFEATVRGSWSLMTLKNVRKGIWGHKGEYRGGKFWQVCDNEWKIGVKPELKDSDVLMVRSEAEVVYRNKTELVTNGSVMVKGSLNCPAGTLYGEASASASARDSLWIYVKAASAAAARLEAARRAEADTAAWAKLHVSAQQSQEVTAHAKIHLECSDAPPPPTDECPDIPGDQPEGYDCSPPDAQDITLVNRVEVGATTSITVSGTIATERTAEVFCRALNGGTIYVGNRQTVTTSPWSVTIGYRAPGEIPDVLTDDDGNVIVQAGHDMVECQVTQDNGLRDVIRTEDGPGKFEIFEMPPDPTV